MMKLMIDERVKHRLIGLAVILSIGAIFAPAIMKKSNQRIDSNVNVSVELPPKPAQPDVALTEEKAMFESAKVAHVELPDVDVSEEQQPLPSLTKAEPLSQTTDVNSQTAQHTNQIVMENREPISSEHAKEDQEIPQEKTPLVINTSAATVHKIAKADSFLPQSKAKIVAKTNKVIKPVAKPKVSLAKPPAKSAVKPVVKKITKNMVKSGFAVQLATFTQQRNAESLVSRLKTKGYQATFSKVKTSTGMVYKVLVGKVQKREQAQLLQKQLASAVQINGFIVATEQG